ncbi:CST complex subunit STN1-like isoform X3 [Xenia sp. Carnegie-2017]|uniref:CST complex subunit STN1-like isoform X3 n=1 Tax=Xenia sp. Carnegie-2017 TaxID=2897299 RepID=UPI001F037F41|nr:CST complex subunit STN1-like isoform X3 [Xenia sp. Carnegie-2017]
MENVVPVKFWGSDPLYWSHVKLFVRDVLCLREYPGFDFYAISNHPVVQVLIVGYVVKVHKKEKLITFEVDDGTGLISCCYWYNEHVDMVDANLGDLVTVMGKISNYHNARQIIISSFYIETDHNVEVLHWLDVMNIREIYLKPFQLHDADSFEKTSCLKNAADTEIYDLEKSVDKEISDYLEHAQVLHFTIEGTLCKNEKIMAVVKELIKYRQRGKSSKMMSSTKPAVKEVTHYKR